MKKIFWHTLALMTVIAALGLWALVDASVAHHNRPMVAERAEPIESISAHPAQYMEGYYA